MPEIVVADLGSGEGLLSELLARKCSQVIAVDNSDQIVKFGQAKAKKNGLTNLDFRQGDLQSPPIDDAWWTLRSSAGGIMPRIPLRQSRGVSHSQAGRAGDDLTL